MISSHRWGVIRNDCTESLPRERRKRGNMTWRIDRASVCLSGRTCSRPVDFPFVSIECDLIRSYFLLWQQHWEHLDWNSLTHWFDSVVCEWPFMCHNVSVCSHWLCMVWVEGGRLPAAGMMEEYSHDAIDKMIVDNCFCRTTDKLKLNVSSDNVYYYLVTMLCTQFCLHKDGWCAACK